jgi:hypothetical protein
MMFEYFVTQKFVTSEREEATMRNRKSLSNYSGKSWGLITMDVFIKYVATLLSGMGNYQLKHHNNSPVKNQLFKLSFSPFNL